MIERIRFSNLSLTLQIIIVNFVVIVISFIFFGLFNFYLISRDLSLEDKKNKLSILSNELVKYLVDNAIKKPLYTVDSKENLAEKLDPNKSRIIKEVELIASDQEDLDPYTLQVILETYYQNINSNIKIYNKKNFILFDSDNYSYSKKSIIKAIDIESIKKASFFDNYKNYYTKKFINLWKLYNHKKYKNALITQFNETPKVVEIIKDPRPITYYYLDDDKSILIKILEPIIKNSVIFGVSVITGSLSDIDQAIAELSFNLFNNLAILVLIVILISIFYARSIIKPIKKLSDITNQYSLNSSMNQVRQSFPKRGDEIGRLSNNLEIMSKELLDRINELERFAADVSHELKNPLTSIKSANEILQKGNKSFDTNNKLISIINKETTKMNRLINDISNYTRTKAEIDNLDSQKVDIIKLLRDMLDDYKENKKNIIFKTRFYSDSNHIFANYEKIEQVISIVFDNAISFSPNSSSILLETKHLNNKIIISIVDQGRGIDFKYKEKIFERFYTDRDNNKDMHSGLGLDIARHIVRSYGGKIYLSDQRIKNYKGACFIIELPLKEN